MAVMALMLGVFVGQGNAASVVYFVDATSASQSGTETAQGGSVWQSVIATADTIRDTVCLFNGAYRSNNFTLTIQDSASGTTIGTFTAQQAQGGYCWVKFPVNVGVTRGHTYYFKFSHPSGINYFYDPGKIPDPGSGMAYGYGRLYLNGTPDQGKDLCARVMGVNRVTPVWGLSTDECLSATTEIDSMISTARNEGAG